ncbi:hypothetical protein RZS08_19025, partial [Arthrospira platensis SPKY1]|nr:hypothetical protein [Arthrospira platensis SPKY1]
MGPAGRQGLPSAAQALAQLGAIVALRERWCQPGVIGLQTWPGEGRRVGRADRSAARLQHQDLQIRRQVAG